MNHYQYLQNKLKILVILTLFLFVCLFPSSCGKDGASSETPINPCQYECCSNSNCSGSTLYCKDAGTSSSQCVQCIENSHCSNGYVCQNNSCLLNYWAKTYGGTGEDKAYSIQQTSDEGFIVAGITESFIIGPSLLYFWVLKLNSDGTIVWQKVYGGYNNDVANSIQQTSDGGYIVAGYTRSFGSGWGGFWLLKLYSDGLLSWQKTYGTSGLQNATSIQQTLDGGYIVAGYTDLLVTGAEDFLLLKLSSDGSIIWQKTYGGSNPDLAYFVQQTLDGGYIVAGETKSFGFGNSDIWVLKLNSDGTVYWQKTYGGTGEDKAYSIHQALDGGYIVAGKTNSFGAGSSDFWILRLDSNGSIIWQKTYGGSDWDSATSIQQTLDGGYIVAGSASSFGGKSDDFWVLKLNSDGSIIWQKTYGGSDPDLAYSIQQTSDRGYAILGCTESFGAGDWDFWILKFNSDGTMPPLGNNTTAIPSDTLVIPVDTLDIPVDSSMNTSGTPLDKYVISTDTDAIIHQQWP